MRKRRKPRVVWLPIDRSNRLGVSGDATAPTATSLGVVSLTVPGGTGNSTTAIVGVVADSPLQIALTGALNSLADVESSGYRLRRIVGKIFCDTIQDDEAGRPISVIVTVGFIILRCHSDGTPLGIFGGLGQEGYAATTLENISDPWIWRRSWRLGNVPLAGSTPGAAIWPETNATAAGTFDGPHIDAKTARIVGPEERLFMVATGTGVEGNSQFQASATIITDLRVLASMRSNVGNRRNASR